MADNYENINDKYYGNQFLDINRRLEVLKNNSNFYLNDEDLEELVKKKCTFGKKRHLSFRQYIKYTYDTEFKIIIKEEIKKLTSLNEKSDALFLWANYKRVLDKTIGLDNVIEDEDGDDNENKEDIKTLSSIYDVSNPLTAQEYLNMLEEEHMVFDLETTGFKSLNQIIEFGGIIYNRKVNKDHYRLKEMLKDSFNENSILSLFKLIRYDYLYDKVIDIIQNINGEDYDINKKREELLNQIDFNEIRIKEDNFKDKVSKIDDFNLKYNRKIHFYFELYKDFVTNTTFHVHHLSNDLICSKSIKIEKIIEGLKKIFENQTILAHNALFDITKIKEFFNDFKIKGPNIKKVINTIDMFQVFNKELKIANKVHSYSLDVLSKLYLGINLKLESDSSKDRHTAIFDVKLTHENIEVAKNTIIKYNNIQELLDIDYKELENIMKILETNFDIINKNNIDEIKLGEIKTYYNKNVYNEILKFNHKTFFYNDINTIFRNYIHFVNTQNIDYNEKDLTEFLNKFKDTYIDYFEKYINKKKEIFLLTNKLLINLGKGEVEKKKKEKVAINNLSLF